MPFQGDYWCLFYVPRALPWAESVLALQAAGAFGPYGEDLRAAVAFEPYGEDLWAGVDFDREILFFGPPGLSDLMAKPETIKLTSKLPNY